MIVDEQFNQANFLLSKLVPTTYERLSTMGTATLWKMIMCAWSYKNNLALPKKKEKRKQIADSLSSHLECCKMFHQLTE